MKARRHLETQQECGHVLIWSYRHRTPKIGERVWCQQCSDFKKVEITPGYWIADCNNCRYKAHRVGEDVIIKSISLHLTANPSHSVWVRNFGQQVSYTVSKSDSPLARPGEMSLFDG